MKLTRRLFLKIGMSQLPVGLALSNTEVVTPEMFGAIGDGIAPDGVAFSDLIRYVNNVGGDDIVTVVCAGRYLLSGTKRQRYAPVGAEEKGGVIFGLPPVTRSNVHFMCSGSQFLVPPSQIWRRVYKGGDEHDAFFNGFEFKGDNARLVGGEFFGNLSNRNVVRGPAISGFGGREFGLVMSGKNWSVDGVVASEWGTDCILITNSGTLKNARVGLGRRNNISVVPMVEDSSCIKVNIDTCQIARGGDWPNNIRNRPGGGVVIEAGKVKSRACVRISNCEFIGNFLKDLQISKGALNCEVINNRFSNDVKIQPNNLGGHILRNNCFESGAHIATIYGKHSSRPIKLEENTFEFMLSRMFYVRKMPRGPHKGERPRVLDISNRRVKECGAV